jgi:hypothetical protein
MSLLQSTTPEITSTPDTISLDGIPSMDAIALDRSLRTFGPDIQSEFGIADDVVKVAEQESKALLRSAITHSLPGDGATRRGTVQTDFEPDDTITHGEDLQQIDEQGFRERFPERSDVHTSTLKFMTYCLLRQGARANDRVLEKEAVDSLNWLEANKSTKPVVKEVLHPTRKDVTKALGRIAGRHRIFTQHRLA